MKITKTDSYNSHFNRFRNKALVLRHEKNRGEGVLKQDGLGRFQAGQDGFTLAEVMVGCVLLAVMVVALYGGISFGFSNVTLARQNLRATQIALEKMEIVRMYSWEQINSNGFVPRTFTAPYYPIINGTNANGGLTYFGRTLITNVNRSTSYSNDMREFRVTLYWTNRNVPQTLQMSTFISQYGMQRYIY